MTESASSADEGATGGIRISVIIPHLNQPAELALCLAALAAGTRAPDEWFVVDNGSAWPPDDICVRFPPAQLLHEPEPGPGPARNRGAAAATGEVLAFVDADCIPDAHWVERIAQAFASDPGLDIAGGEVGIACADAERPTVWESYDSVYAFRQRDYILREGFSGAGNLAVRRSVFSQVGPFAGVLLAEDRDWGLRARAMGVHTRYHPEIRVLHPARNGFGAHARKWQRVTAHQYSEARGQRVPLAFMWLRVAALALSPLVELPRLATTDRIKGPRARGQAALLLARIRLYRSWLMACLLLGRAAESYTRNWNR